MEMSLITFHPLCEFKTAGTDLRAVVLMTRIGMDSISCGSPVGL
jgi:hypothetical protein